VTDEFLRGPRKLEGPVRRTCADKVLVTVLCLPSMCEGKNPEIMA